MGVHGDMLGRHAPEACTGKIRGRRRTCHSGSCSLADVTISWRRASSCKAPPASSTCVYSVTGGARRVWHHHHQQLWSDMVSKARCTHTLAARIRSLQAKLRVRRRAYGAPSRRPRVPASTPTPARARVPSRHGSTERYRLPRATSAAETTRVSPRESRAPFGRP